MKILFLFFEGLATNVIDSQVLLHCKNMKSIGIEFEIWAFACNDKLYKDSLERINYAKNISNCEVKVFKGIRPAFPFSEKLNANKIRKYIKQYHTKFEFIHARTDYSAHVASLITNNFIWDCRGDTLAEFNTQYKNIKNYFGKIYKLNKIKKNILNAKKAKKAIFVSNFLKQKHNYMKESYIIGCLADENLFFFDENIRNNKREELNLNKDDKILIYSGGMAHYQMFPETIKFFKDLNEDWKLIVLTTNTDIAKKELENIEKNRYILKSAKIEEVNSYLNAADVGIMLREQNDLNRAASPTKYAEYSMSGLQIIYSDNIGDLSTYNNEILNRVSKDDLLNFNINIPNRIKISNNTKKLLSKKNSLNKYQDLYFQ